MVVLLAVGVWPSGGAVSAQAGIVQGRVHDGEGVAVVGAAVRLEASDGTTRSVVSGRLGSFRFPTVPAGAHALEVTALGFAEHTSVVDVEPGETVDLEIALSARAIELEGLSVEAERSRERARFEEVAGVTVREMDLAQMRGIPGVAETDPVRAIEVLPGVVSTSDFSASFHVRGGSQDQNLILLDGAPIFSPFHLGGLFSVFNADLIERVELSSGGFGAEHGGRVSSVLEIESDVGDGATSVDAGLSLLASRAAVGGGLPTGAAEALGQSSVRYRASARRSYFDVLLKPLFEFPYHLTDFQTVLEGWSQAGNQLTLTAYSGRDVLDLTRLDADDFPLRVDWDWGNDLVGLRWRHPRRGGGSLSLHANMSRFATGLQFPDFADTDFQSRIRQAQLRADLDTRPTARWRVGAGVGLERMAYDNRFVSGGTRFSGGEGTGSLVGSYLKATWSRPNAWLLESGVRADTWIPDPGSPTVAVSPRVALKRFMGGGETAVKVAAGRYTQFLHSLRDEELPLGLDIWILAGARAPHLVSDQLQVGVEGYLGSNWFWSVEGYLRDFDGVVAFNPADDPNDELDDILEGRGTSRGVDLFLRRERGDVTGWLAVSLLEADRTFADPFSAVEPRPEITYPPVFDRRLDMDLVLRYPAPWGWEGGVRLNVGTGTPFTRPVGTYAYHTPRFVDDGGRLRWSGSDGDDGSFDPGFAVQLGDRNQSRYPTYHRLDLSFRKSMTKSWGTLVPYVNLVNAYNQKNVLFYSFDYEDDPPVRSGVSMFPVLPTVGLEVRF
ncbi:MAG: TonB-dependent receptor [Gemmatimonadota bacterium]|nr:TonB-dependent receptor [Gemmatimonadota bacterium]